MITKLKESTARASASITRIRDSNGNDISQNGSSQDFDLTLSGLATPRAAVTLVVNDLELSPISASVDGNWERSHTAGFAGPHRFTVYTDADPEESAPWLVDLLETDPTIESVVDRYGEPIEQNATTSETQPTLAGYATPFSQVSIWVNGILFSHIRTNLDGKWEKLIFIGGILGEAVLTAHRDHPENPVVSPPWMITIVPVVPEIRRVTDSLGTDIENGGGTQDTQLTLSGVATPLAQVFLKLNGDNFGTLLANSDESWATTIFTDFPGDHSFTVQTAGTEESAPWVIIRPSAKRRRGNDGPQT